MDRSVPSWARKARSPAKARRKKTGPSSPKRPAAARDGQQPVRLFPGDGGGRLQQNEAHFRLNSHNLPERWFKDHGGGHGGGAGSAGSSLLPAKAAVRPFPSHIPATKRARKFGAGPDRNVARAEILRFDADAEAQAAAEQAAAAEAAALAAAPNVRVKDPSFLKLDQSKLALEIFDDPQTYELLFPAGQSPAVWLANYGQPPAAEAAEAAGKAATEKEAEKSDGAPAPPPPVSGAVHPKATSPYYDGTAWAWRDCKVLGYSDADALFEIKFIGVAKTKRVRRLSVCFKDEDQQQFKERMAYCMALRETTKREMRLDHFLDSQPDGGVEQVPDWTLDHIARRIGSAKLLQGVGQSADSKQGRLLRELVADVGARYTRTCKKIVLNLRLPNNVREELKLPLTEDGGGGGKPAAPWFGKIQLDADRMPFEDAKAAVRKKLFVSHPGVRRTIVDMYMAFFDKYSKMTFVDCAYTKEDLRSAGPLTLDEFVARQEQACKALLKTLNADWRRQIVDTLLDHCAGHFNFYQSDVERFKRSKLFVFLRILAVRMGAIMRDIVERSVAELVSFVSKARAEGLSIFATKLEVRPDSAGAEGAYATAFEPALEDIGARAIKGSVARIIEAAGQIQCVDVDLMTLLRIEAVPVLSVSAASLGLEYMNLLPKAVPEDDLDDGLDDADGASQGTVSASSSKKSLKKGAGAAGTVVDPPEAIEEITPEAAVAAAQARIAHSPFLQELVGICKRAGVQVDTDAEAAFDTARELAGKYAAYLDILTPATAQEVAAFAAKIKDADYDAIQTILQRFVGARDNADATSSDRSELAVVAVSCVDIKALVADSAAAHISTILDALNVALRVKNAAIIADYKDILQKVSVKPTDEEELIKLKAFVNSLGTVVRQTKKRVEGIHELLSLAGSYGFRVPYDDFELAYGTMEWPQRVNWAFTESQDALEKEKKKMQKQLDRDKIAFEKHIESLQARQVKFLEYSDLEQLATIVDEAIALDADLTEAESKGEDFNRREAAFGWDPTSYASIDGIRAEFKEFFELWTMYADFENNVEGWVSGPFLSLKATEVSEFVTMAYQKSYKLKNKLSSRAPGAADVAADLREKTAAFRKNVPLLEALGSKALIDRHWMMLSERLGHDLIPDQELTMQVCGCVGWLWTLLCVCLRICPTPHS